MVRVIDVISDELMIDAMLQTFFSHLEYFFSQYFTSLLFSRNSQHARTHMARGGEVATKVPYFGVKSAKVLLGADGHQTC